MMRRGGAWLLVGPATAIAALAAFVVLTFVWGGDTQPSLADRINAACTRPGYQVFDWTTGDEWKPIPEGVVQVTCVRYGKEGGTVDQYVAAVRK